jgi:hypothetical protein
MQTLEGWRGEREGRRREEEEEEKFLFVESRLPQLRNSSEQSSKVRLDESARELSSIQLNPARR